MTLLPEVFALVTGGTIVWSGLAHAVRGGVLRKALSQQGIWPSPLIRPIAALLTAVELIAGAVCLGDLAGIMGRLTISQALRWTGLSALYLLFAVVALILVMRGSGAPCGCDAEPDRPANAWSVLRALGLAGMAAAPAWQAWHGDWTTDAWRESIASEPRVLLISLGLAIVLWLLPSSLGHPQVDDIRDVTA